MASTSSLKELNCLTPALRALRVAFVRLVGSIDEPDSPASSDGLHSL